MSLDENIALGALPLDKSAIFLCDLQEKFRPAMLHFAAVVSNAKKLVIKQKWLICYQLTLNIVFKTNYFVFSYRLNLPVFLVYL